MADFSCLQEALDERRSRHLYRHLNGFSGPQQPHQQWQGEACISFCSNDYLGFAARPELAEAMAEGARLFGTGSGSSHLVNGHHEQHRLLEQELADFLGYPRVVLFSSGFMANQALISVLTGKQDQILQDRLNHASLIDGALFSGARFRRFRHLDYHHLASQYRSGSRRTLVVSDGVFSMDGDVAELGKLAAFCSQQDAWLMVDDAHGIGVMGQQGRGLVNVQGMNSESVPLLTGTFGKAFGTAGAFIACPEQVAETLEQFARPFIYTTAMPPVLAYTSRRSLVLLRGADVEREHLRQMVSRFRQEMSAMGYQLMDSATPVQPVMLGEAEVAVSVSQVLADQGVRVSAIRPPTVPAGSSRLRVTFSARHSWDDFDRLIMAFRAARERAL